MHLEPSYTVHWAVEFTSLTVADTQGGVLCSSKRLNQHFVNRYHLL